MLVGKSNWSKIESLDSIKLQILLLFKLLYGVMCKDILYLRFYKPFGKLAFVFLHIKPNKMVILYTFISKYIFSLVMRWRKIYIILFYNFLMFDLKNLSSIFKLVYLRQG